MGGKSVSRPQADWSGRPVLRQIPNTLTALRLAAIPFFCWLLITDQDQLAGYVFIAAAMTDMLDGQIARRCNIISPFGQYFDPVADRLLVISAVVLLSLTDPRLPEWAFLLVLGRDVISAVWFSLIHKRVRPQVSLLGKASTATLMLSLVCMFVTDAMWPAQLLWIGVGMAFIVTFDYIVRYERYLPHPRQ